MQQLAKKYLLGKTTATHIQFFRYLLVGGLATIFDMGAFYVLRNSFNWHYIIAQTGGFLLGVSINYILSIAWVFKSSGNFKKELIFFLLIGIGGLILSYFILWILIDKMHLAIFQDMLSKSITVVIVLIWNFTARKKLVFKN